MSAKPEMPTIIDSLTFPNRTVREHYDSPATRSALSREAWDLVVLQAASYETTDRNSVDEFRAYSALITKEIQARGADAALFMTWPYRFSPSMIEALASEHVEAGNRASALVVPVGLAWATVDQQRSTGFLYSDTKHPSLSGTYLAACVFYATLFSDSPVGLPYTAGLPRDEVLYLQRVAWQTTQRFFDFPAPESGRLHPEAVEGQRAE